MTHVLIVDDDATLRETLARAACSWGFDTSSEASAEAALEHIKKTEVDVLVTDLRLGGDDGIDLIRNAAEISPKTRTVLMSAYATAREQQLATKYGTVRVLCKPFLPADLQSALAQALDSRKGYHGTIHGLSLVDMLQMFHMARRSVSIVIGGTRPGRIHFQEGELIAAESGELTGREAFSALLRSESGSIATSAPAKVKRNIEGTFDGLLMDALRELDEGTRARISMGPPGLNLDEAFSSTPPTTAELDSGRQSMGKMDEACKSIVQDVDGGVACGVVDLHTGMLLGIFNNAGYSQSLNEIVAAACMDMFRGSNVSRVHQAVRAHRGIPEDGSHYFEEIHITSANNFHFMKTIQDSKAVIVLVTTKSTNVGMGWASLKTQIPKIEPLVP